QELIEAVVGGSPGHPFVGVTKGQLLCAQQRYELAIPRYEAGLALNRNSGVAVPAPWVWRVFFCAIAEAIHPHELPIRLSPRDPRLPNWYWRIGMVHLLQSRNDEALVWLERARNTNPRLAGPHAWLASAYSLRGYSEGATAELAEAQRLSGDKR